MDVVERKVRLFMLRTFKLIYQAMKVKFPSALQIEIEKFPSAETGFFFNDNISKGVLVLTRATFEKLTHHYEEFPSLNSQRFFEILARICMHRKPCEFLKFTVGYAMQAAYNGDDESFRKVWRAVEMFFIRAIEENLLSSSTWVRIERVALRFVEEDYIKCLRMPDYDPSQQLNLENEKSFVLRVMQRYFKLNSKELPDLFYEEIRKLDEKRYQLTANVRRALLLYVRESEQYKANVKEEPCRNKLFRFSSYEFTALNYFDMCICFTKKAFEDFFFYRRPLSPYQVFETLVKVLQGFRDRGLPVPWDEIENAASTIVKENDGRYSAEADIIKFEEEIHSTRHGYQFVCICNMCHFVKKENTIPEEDCFDILQIYP